MSKRRYNIIDFQIKVTIQLLPQGGGTKDVGKLISLYRKTIELES